ncbi:MAG: hypothetical protein KAR32_07560 [Candidatus Omnitrophica bacterium]|nr:hypothetical protein [Candidatus Omnitrophota bacterium]MCK5259503.1 hypothetical protein [Candidatus Omnitrophota bacterium]
MRDNKTFPIFSITNPNKVWVSEQIDKLIKEWKDWNSFCQDLGDSPEYDPNTCSAAIKDGWENIKKHEILREKTLVFLRNHFSGGEFILEKWPFHPHEDVTSRLRNKVPSWIHRLEILKASMDYVRVPDGFWKERGKEIVEVISRSGAEKAVDLAASYLKNPLGQ